MRFTERLLLLAALALTPTAFAAPDELRDSKDVVVELDALFAKTWAEEGVKPAKPASDTEFFRRLSLDLTGVIPTEDEANALIGKRRKKKGRKAQLIQALLHGKNYSNFMSTRWANLLLGREYQLRQGGERAPLVRWLQQQFQANTHWDTVAKSLIAAEGRVDKNGAAQYLVRYDRKPEEMAGNLMRVFQGQQVQCAQCHDHPYKENWKQESFWGVAAFFSRVAQRRDDVAMTYILSEREQGEVRLPSPPGKRGALVEPKFITGESIDPGKGAYRRTELARIVTSKSNPWFVRATVNRVWKFFFGVGFTDPDDMSKPDLAPILKILEDDFRASGNDMRRLAHVIVSTRAYGLTSTGNAKTKDAQVELFARARLRALTAEQLWWSFEEAVGLGEALEYISRNDTNENAVKDRRRNMRRGFFSVFGQEESGPQTEYSLTQAFAMLNGVLTNDLLLPNRNPVIKRLLKRDADALTSGLFLRVLGRPATKGERKALRAGSRDKAGHIQDIIWALLNSSEFVYNH
jgi:hypothetical protein